MLIDSTSLLCLELFSSFHFTFGVFTDFTIGFIHLLFKGLQHTQNSYFEVLVLCFLSIAFIKAYLIRTLSSSRNIFFTIIDCIFNVNMFRMINILTASVSFSQSEGIWIIIKERKYRSSNWFACRWVTRWTLCLFQWMAVNIHLCICQALIEPLRRQLWQALSASTCHPQ